jgi:hypothetical protein
MKESQTDRLYALLKDGMPRRTDEILRVVYGGEHLGIARIGARIADLKEGKHTARVKCDIPRARPDAENPSLSWYQILPPDPRLMNGLVGELHDVKIYKPGEPLLPPQPVEHTPTQLFHA